MVGAGVELIEDFIDVNRFNSAVYTLNNYGYYNNKYGLWPSDYPYNQQFLDELLAKEWDAVNQYAAKNYNGKQIAEPSKLGLSLYLEGCYNEEHTDDSYFDQREEEKGGVIKVSQTVSTSLILEKAELGGTFYFQDPERQEPVIRFNPPPGTLLLFPGNWHHKVGEIYKGTRRSIVGWWL